MVRPKVRARECWKESGEEDGQVDAVFYTAPKRRWAACPIWEAILIQHIDMEDMKNQKWLNNVECSCSCICINYCLYRRKGMKS
jgi:hypothetical protein